LRLPDRAQVRHRDSDRTGRIAGRVTLDLLAALVVVGSIGVLSGAGLLAIAVLAAGSLARVYPGQRRRRLRIPGLANGQRAQSGHLAGSGPPATVSSPFESPAFWELTGQEAPRTVDAMPPWPTPPAWDPLLGSTGAPTAPPVRRSKRAIFYRLLASAVLLATAPLLASDLVGWWGRWLAADIGPRTTHPR
jgi:hypothetical protein